MTENLVAHDQATPAGTKGGQGDEAGGTLDPAPGRVVERVHDDELGAGVTHECVEAVEVVLVGVVGVKLVTDDIGAEESQDRLVGPVYGVLEHDSSAGLGERRQAKCDRFDGPVGHDDLLRGKIVIKRGNGLSQCESTGCLGIIQ